jgi:hypothetical protein
MLAHLAHSANRMRAPLPLKLKLPHKQLPKPWLLPPSQTLKLAHLAHSANRLKRLPRLPIWQLTLTTSAHSVTLA